MAEEVRPLFWIGGSRKDLSGFPEDVKDVMGYALHLAQAGEKSPAAKPLKGFGGAGVLEIVDDHDGDTFRAVYTVRFGNSVYVLHAFQKKSKRGDRDTGGGEQDHQVPPEAGGKSPSGGRRRKMSKAERSSGNVFADLGFADAAGHHAKAELVRKIAAVMAERGLSQNAAAPLVGVSQPDISRLLGGRFRDVSVERLLRMLQRLDCEVDIIVQHAGHEVGDAIHLQPEYA